MQNEIRVQETSGANKNAIDRRRFIRDASAAAASLSLFGSLTGASAQETPTEPKRKIKLGIVGCGGRGSWIANLFKEHGGYEMHAVADYFQEPADACGDALGVDKSRRFTGLSGYKKVLESGVEAIVIIDVPCFYPEQAKDAVDAGCHVYIAKPVAVDAPGCLAIGEAGKKATQKGQCFLVDYQMPTAPHNVEIAKRIREGGLGKLTTLTTVGARDGNYNPQPKAVTMEDRLRGNWGNFVAMGGDMIVNFDIHSIDVATWVLGARPISATGLCAQHHPDPAGDNHNVFMVVFECPGGVIWTHDSLAGPDHRGNGLICGAHGLLASAQMVYWGKSFLRGGPQHYAGGETEDPYLAGAQCNIEDFYRSIVEERFDNPTVKRAVDGTLAAILGREAAVRRTALTMDELLRENKKLEVDLTGLKV